MYIYYISITTTRRVSNETQEDIQQKKILRAITYTFRYIFPKRICITMTRIFKKHEKQRSTRQTLCQTRAKRLENSKPFHGAVEPK